MLLYRITISPRSASYALPLPILFDEFSATCRTQLLFVQRPKWSALDGGWRGAWKYEYFAMQLREHMCAKNCWRYIRRAYIFNVERLAKGGRLGKLLRSYLPCKFDEMQILLKTLPTGRERERERAYSCMWNVANVDDDDDYRNPRRYPHPRAPSFSHFHTIALLFTFFSVVSAPPRRPSPHCDPISYNF